MDWIKDGIEIFLHLDRHLNEWAGYFGPWLYVVLFAVMFCETGLVVTPFLPGDSLLFAVGALASIDGSPISVGLMMVVLFVAAVLGDAVNYSIGNYVGPKVFSRPDSIFLNHRHLEAAQEFYERHGGKTIFLARFVPMIRTFAPFVAGIGKMRYPAFAMWNVSGAFVWVVTLTMAGYWFGQVPFVKNNFEIVILTIIALSVVPVVTETIRERRRQRS